MIYIITGYCIDTYVFIVTGDDFCFQAQRVKEAFQVKLVFQVLQVLQDNLAFLTPFLSEGMYFRVSVQMKQVSENTRKLFRVCVCVSV